MKNVLGALLAIFTLGYMLPTAIAMWTNQKDAAAIFFLNLLLGWTVLGWIIALIWALKK